jgi:hypothetical protein
MDSSFVNFLGEIVYQSLIRLGCFRASLETRQQANKAASGNAATARMEEGRAGETDFGFRERASDVLQESNTLILHACAGPADPTAERRR